MRDYCKCRFPKPKWAGDTPNRFICTYYCTRCLKGIKPKKPHTTGLDAAHQKAEREYPVTGHIISFERVSRGIAPPDPSITLCDICDSDDYLVFKCPDALYRCATCFKNSVAVSMDDLIKEE